MAHTPTPVERELLGVYRDAEHALLVAGTRAVAHAAKATAKTEARRRAGGLRAVRAATAQVVAALDRNAPGLIVASIRAGARLGERQAAQQLTARIGPRPRDAVRAVNLPAIDQLAASVVGRAQQAHATVLRTVPDAYRRAVARAVPHVLVGTETRLEAAQRAWWDLTRQGVTGARSSCGASAATRLMRVRMSSRASRSGGRAGGRRQPPLPQAFSASLTTWSPAPAFSTVRIA